MNYLTDNIGLAKLLVYLESFGPLAGIVIYFYYKKLELKDTILDKPFTAPFPDNLLLIGGLFALAALAILFYLFPNWLVVATFFAGWASFFYTAHSARWHEIGKQAPEPITPEPITAASPSGLSAPAQKLADDLANILKK